MDNSNFSYNDLVKLIDHLSGGSGLEADFCETDKDLKEIQSLICLDNQYFNIIQFPAFKAIYTSPSIKDVLGYDSKEITLKRLYGLIHPEDYPIVLLATKKMCEFVIDHYHSLQAFKSVISMDFRILHKDGHYIRLFNQNCLFKKDDGTNKFKILALCTDISHVKNNAKMEFNYTDNGNGISCEFPDQELAELYTLFTHRERQVLALLAIGKSSTEIGKMLEISRHTVDTHRRKMLSKSHLGNTTELVAYSILNHLMDGN